MKIAIFNLFTVYHFLLLIFFAKLVSPYMMGIDLGSEYFKVTVIKPGKPFMMMENLLSKTKTENALGLKEDEISYSYDALSKKEKPLLMYLIIYQNI